MQGVIRIVAAAGLGALGASLGWLGTAGAQQTPSAAPPTGAPPASSTERAPVEDGFGYREGFHVGISAGATVSPLFDAHYLLGSAGRVGFVANFGIAPAVDFRTGLDVKLGTLFDRFAFYAALPAKLQLNLGSIYTMAVGAYLGVASTERAMEGCEAYAPVPTGCLAGEFRVTNLWFGPMVSLLTFRFGAERQYELGAEGTLVLGTFPQKDDPIAWREGQFVVHGLHLDATFTWLAL